MLGARASASLVPCGSKPVELLELGSLGLKPDWLRHCFGQNKDKGSCWGRTMIGGVPLLRVFLNFLLD